MIYVVNILTILFVVVVALQISNEKNKYFLSLVLIVMGVAYHIVEAYFNYQAGECSYNENMNLIAVIDHCINYESGSMFFAQAFIVGGFTIIFVSYVLSRRSDK
jgi:hypothetical protein